MNVHDDILNDIIKEEDDVPKPERRNSKRFEERVSARFENGKCSVLNVSDKGVLLQTEGPSLFFPLAKTVDFDLQVNGVWIHLRGKIMWVQSDVQHSKVGLSIQNAPEVYFNFLRELYE